MTRFGWSVLSVLGVGVLALVLALTGALPWPAASGTAQDITLQTRDGASDLLWHCRPKATPAETRARAAHDAFETGLEDISSRAADAMAQALAKASANAEVPEDLTTIDDAAEAEAHALADRLDAEFACRLDSF